MAENIGRCACPVCGEPSQDLRINKNLKLYCFCDNGCKSQLNSKNSKWVLAALRAGKAVDVPNFGHISPLKAAAELAEAKAPEKQPEKIETAAAGEFPKNETLAEAVKQPAAKSFWGAVMGDDLDL